jgi:hypothetical protein
MLYALVRRQGFSKKIAKWKNAYTVFGNASHTRQCKMIPKKTLLFAPCAFNLAETSRMVEIAKAVQTNFSARDAFPWVTDLTAEGSRTQAMALVGITIGTSFMVALVAGPIFAGVVMRP